MTQPDTRVDRISEYREIEERTRVIRRNALELNNLLEEGQLVTADGRDGYDPEKFDRLVTGIRRTAEDLEGMDFPDPNG